MPDSPPPLNPTESAPASVLSYSSPPTASTSAVIWCRLLAICMLGWGLQSLLTVAIGTIDSFRRFGFDPNTFGYFLGYMLPTLVWLALAWDCWARAPSLADRMSRDRSDTNSSHGMTSDELLSTFIIAIGIYLLTEGLPAIAWQLYESISRARFGSATGFNGNTVAAILRCFIGLWFILGTRGVLTIIRRHSGKWRDESVPPTHT
jgi:hypothetical protein